VLDYDYLGFLKSMEELLEEGLVEEKYSSEAREHMYRITEKGEKFFEELVRKDPDAFDLMVAAAIYFSNDPLDFVKTLLFLMYKIFYGMSDEEAALRAEQFFKGD